MLVRWPQEMSFCPNADSGFCAGMASWPYTVTLMWGPYAVDFQKGQDKKGRKSTNNLDKMGQKGTKKFA